MNQDDITKYKSLYLQTSWGYLNMLRKNLAFIQNGTQKDNVVESAHLAAHSLKSQSILMGYNQIGELSEKMEKLFKAVMEKSFVLDDATLGVMLSGLKKIQSSLAQISENGQDLDMSEEINELDSTIKNIN